MQKPEKIDWKDTNVAGIGSDLDHKIKKAAAEGEPQWTGIGEKAETRVWRIEQFRVVAWPKSKHGKFHVGDSYVVLHSFVADPTGRSPKLAHDLYIWIGAESTADEYGTAAYKMVECDELLGGSAVQHRETQDKESDAFVGLFAGGRISLLEGGAASGFRHVEATAEVPHLFRVKGRGAKIELRQMKLRRDEMNSGDVFVLDAGADGGVWQWNGAESNKDERAKGAQVAADLAAAAGGGARVRGVLDQGAGGDGEDECPEFWKHLPGQVAAWGGLTTTTLDVQVAEKGGDDDAVRAHAPTLFAVTARGASKVATAAPVAVTAGAKPVPRIARQKLDARKVMILDTGFHVFVFVGADAPADERRGAFARAETYLKAYRRPDGLPVSVVKGGQREPSAFEACFYDAPPAKGCCVIA